MKHFVGDCPFRLMHITNPCDHVPAHFICGTADCWEMANKMKDIDWLHIDPCDFGKFEMAICTADPQTVDRLIAAYTAQRNPAA